jgi:hypothetical protein
VKWKTVLTAIIKNEVAYIDDWLSYHMSVGIEHFVIYDNESNDETSAKLRKYINGGRVTLIFWPMRGGQIDAYNHAAKLMAGNAEWIGYLDVDEFLVLHNHDVAYDFLESLDADQVILPWRNFSYGGHNASPGGSALENYFWAHRVAQDGITQVKHFVRPDLIERVTAHCSTIRSENTKLPTGEHQRPTHVIKNPTFSGAQINHYATRSFVENQERMRKGQVSGSSHKRIEEFAPMTEGLAARLDYDDSIIRHFLAFKVESRKWREVADYPHRFGLQQTGPHLSALSNFLFYLTKSFGNYLKNEQTIKPVTDFKFLQTKDSGEVVDVARMTDESRRMNFYFQIQTESLLKYFQGTIHCGDFVRRFGFDCIFSARRQRVESVWSMTIRAGMNGIMALVDLDSAAPVDLQIKLSDGSRILTTEHVPAGRHCVILYVPKITQQDSTIKLEIKGACLAGEILFGLLPI